MSEPTEEEKQRWLSDFRIEDGGLTIRGGWHLDTSEVFRAVSWLTRNVDETPEQYNRRIGLPNPDDWGGAA